MSMEKYDETEDLKSAQQEWEEMSTDSKNTLSLWYYFGVDVAVNYRNRELVPMIRHHHVACLAAANARIRLAKQWIENEYDEVK